ncbi:MAG: DEAD/DEAH box helicase, partial [Nanoarchaeota archaeon]|nr:DEAD/DEAH box helicase [Nanoarchaeota archaeon]
MGFYPDVERIISKCPKERQTLLFSATISHDVEHLSKKHTKNSIMVSTNPYVDPTKLKQVFYDVQSNLKFSLLVHLLKEEKSELVMVFCNTKRAVDMVAKMLKKVRISANAIHGDLAQNKRQRTLSDFHKKNINVLVCTDVAARGLDIKGVTHVYNYDIPSKADDYIHRIGRTARAKKEGKVINLLSDRDYENFDRVLRANPELKIERKETPKIEVIQVERDREDRFGRRGERRSFGRRDLRRDGRSFGGRDTGRDRRSFGRERLRRQ